MAPDRSAQVGVDVSPDRSCRPCHSRLHPCGAGAAADQGEWTMPARDYQGTRYSELAQINVGNAKQLKVAWTVSTGVNKGQEAAPLVVGDTMYVVTPFPNYLYALDLKNNGATKWRYEPNPASAAQGFACCDVVNRGCVLFQRQGLLQHPRRLYDLRRCEQRQGSLEDQAR